MAVILLLLATQFPSATATSWMEPAAFHLTLGSLRTEVELAFSARGWSLEKESDTSLVHEYGDGKALVLEFRDDRLTSIRFELVSFVPELRDDWTAVVEHLNGEFGEPEYENESLLVLRDGEMAIHAVLDHRPESDLGKQGAGRIIVRYFVPSDLIGSRDTSR